MNDVEAENGFRCSEAGTSSETRTLPASRRRISLRLKIALIIAVLAISSLVLPPVRYALIMSYVHARMERGDMGYTTDAEDGLAFLEGLTRDKVWLANRLLAEPDGSLACEGMVLAYRIHHPDLRRILEEHLTDTRWNWSMSLNTDIARQLLDHLDGHEEQVQPFVRDWITNWPH